MLATDETALMCDLAETYGIYDYKMFPATMIAAYATGLRDDARIKLKMNGMAYSLETMLLAAAVDKLSLILWSKTKDGKRNRNRPKMLVEMLERNLDQDIASFETAGGFENTWKSLAGGERHGN